MHEFRHWSCYLDHFKPDFVKCAHLANVASKQVKIVKAEKWRQSVSTPSRR